MAIYNDYRRKKPSKFRRFIWIITPDWWDDLWWDKSAYSDHDIIFGGKYYIKKTFKLRNLALIIAIGTLISFLIHIL